MKESTFWKARRWIIGLVVAAACALAYNLFGHQHDTDAVTDRVVDVVDEIFEDDNAPVLDENGNGLVDELPADETVEEELEPVSDVDDSDTGIGDPLE